MRLAALRESPHFFLSGYEKESRYSAAQWRAEFDRGTWYLGVLDGTPVSLLGVTREPGAPDSQCYLEYLWVRPGRRGGGVGLAFVSQVLARLRVASVQTVFLWVMDGNTGAGQLYRKAGFVPAGCPQPLAARPGRSESLMKRELSRPGAAGPGWPARLHPAHLAMLSAGPVTGGQAP
jgi:GNAT superfamily N-acetyltransferase